MDTPEIRIVERVEPDKTKHWLFTQGNIELEVFENDVIKSIDSIDRLPAGRWTEFAVQNDLPVEPLDRKLLKPPLQGIIQLACQLHFTGKVSERLRANQERRVATYKEDIEHLKLLNDTPTNRMVKARTTTSEGKPRAVGIGFLYRLRQETCETWCKFTSQKGYIIAVMMACKAVGPQGNGVSKDVIVNALRGKLNTRQPEDRVVGFYMSDWQKEGIVERVDETVGKATEVPADWEQGVMTADKVKEIEKEVRQASKKQEPVPPAQDPKPEAPASSKPAVPPTKETKPKPAPAAKKSAGKK